MKTTLKISKKVSTSMMLLVNSMLLTFHRDSYKDFSLLLFFCLYSIASHRHLYMNTLGFGKKHLLATFYMTLLAS